MQTNWKLRWKIIAVRALKTIAQTAIGCIGAEAILNQINWTMVFSTALLAGVVSILNNISALPEIGPMIEKREVERSPLMEQDPMVSPLPSSQSKDKTPEQIPILSPGDQLPASLLEEFTNGKGDA